MDTIGKYQVRRVLGRGSMGTVYEAVDSLSGRRVAVKTMIKELATDANLRARFLREAQAAGGLRHQNIVTVFELGEHDGTPYIVMEFIEGTDLEKIIQRREPLSLEWKLDLLRQICEGLGHAHENGIVHRDIKPANIRVTPAGEVKIMDFGIAHLQSSNITKTGHILGTVHYMSPEQVRGEKVDRRTDIFAVGTIAYELIASRRPFEADSLTGIMMKIAHERADPAALPPTAYSPGLEAIVMKALGPTFEERYRSLEEMHADLERLVRETAPKLAAGRIEDRSPDAGNPSNLTSLDEEEARRGADALTATAQEHLALGNLEEALAATEEALAAYPAHALAREIHERTARVTEALRKAEVAPPAPAAPPPLPAAPAEASRKLEVESLTSAALDHFVANNHPKARLAVEKALALDPENKKARELQKILSSLR